MTAIPDNSQRIAKIQRLLKDAFLPSHLEIIDDSHKHIGHAGARGGGGHFTLKISSEEFTGKSSVQCHRMIYTTLGDMMSTDIHALSIQIVNN
ncbi:MAG: BolA family protein [Pseudomonadota bacterium]